MNAIILAAGRGERMRPLTDITPKALLIAGGKPLIVWHLEKLVAAGFLHVVINCAHLGDQIVRALGDGSRYGASIDYSHEEQALETAGGIAHALPLLAGDTFVAVNADVYCDFDYRRLRAIAPDLNSSVRLAHLVLVDNPEHHPGGDFALRPDGMVMDQQALTFAGIAIYHRALFRDLAHRKIAPLAPLLRRFIAAGKITGEHHVGTWCDVGTPERLTALNESLLRQQL